MVVLGFGQGGRGSSGGSAGQGNRRPGDRNARLTLVRPFQRQSKLLPSILASGRAVQRATAVLSAVLKLAPPPCRSPSQDLAPNPEGRARDKYLNTIRYRPWSAIEQGRLHSAVYDFVKRGLIELSIAAGLEINPAAYPVNAVLAQADNIELDWQQIAQGVSNPF